MPTNFRRRRAQEEKKKTFQSATALLSAVTVVDNYSCGLRAADVTIDDARLGSVIVVFPNAASRCAFGFERGFLPPVWREQRFQISLEDEGSGSMVNLLACIHLHTWLAPWHNTRLTEACT